MAAAILHSIKQGAYTAIALYVVFIAVVTLTSMNPQVKHLSYHAPGAEWGDVQTPARGGQERAS